jgi:hypothetical protein
MNEDEKYLFDLNGYLTINTVLTSNEVTFCNEAVEHHADQICERVGEHSLSGGSKTLKGLIGRGDLGGILGWEKPWGNPFRKMLAHPRIVPYLNEILGQGFRIDHSGLAVDPGLITMRKGAEGHLFHGSFPDFDPYQYYICKNGKIYCGLTVVTWQLTDMNSGDGGLCVIQGSHKSNFPCPIKMTRYEKYQEAVKQITCKAGDVIIFTEALTHGTLPWKAEHQRRSVLFRYSPASLAYAKDYFPNLPAKIRESLTEEQKAVLEPPYHTRLSRPVLDNHGKKVK